MNNKTLALYLFGILFQPFLATFALTYPAIGDVVAMIWYLAWGRLLWWAIMRFDLARKEHVR